MTDVERFLKYHPDWADLPESVIRKSFAFQAWAFGETVNGVSNAIAETFRPLLDWMDSKLGGDA